VCISHCNNSTLILVHSGNNDNRNSYLTSYYVREAFELDKSGVTADW